MFVCVEFGGSTGHSGVLLTGLGPKSCFLHLSGTSYPKRKDAKHGWDSPSVLTRDLTGRVLIPSLEDGNSRGVSETMALDYWRYYKVKTFNHPDWGEIWKDESRGGRKKAFDAKYSNENHNCSLFANRLLIAACVGTLYDSDSGLLITLKHSWSLWIKQPGWFMDRARNIREQVLQSIVDNKETPIYGYKLENLTHLNASSRYYPWDNLSGGKKEVLPHGLDGYQDVDPTPPAPQVPTKEEMTPKFVRNKEPTRAPGAIGRNGEVQRLESLFQSISGL